MTQSARPMAPIEPVLDMHDIQGIAVPGFFKPHQTLLYLQLPKEEEALLRCRQLIAQLGSAVSTAADTLDDRRAHRRLAAGGRKKTARPRPLMAISFTYSGLSRLVPASYAIPSVAFKLGLPARSALLGDPTDPEAE